MVLCSTDLSPSRRASVGKWNGKYKAVTGVNHMNRGVLVCLLFAGNIGIYLICILLLLLGEIKQKRIEG